MDNAPKGVGLNPNTYYVHLTDHLAPLCIILGIPLLLTDKDRARQAEKYYPGLQTLLVDWQTITPQFLFENFDIFYQSEPWPRKQFYRIFEELEKHHHKTVRNVHVPHGFSDKLYWFEQCAREDILLVYGQNMLDMYQDLGLTHHLNTIVRTGNYRYQYYLKNKGFFDAIVEKEIWSQFEQEQSTILYAPTWDDPGGNTSFADSDPLLANLPDSYNLLIKTHPILEEIKDPFLYQMMAKYKKKKNIVFVKDIPLVYPILSRSSIYIGDMSSLGYDFLSFNRPMFFFNQTKKEAKSDHNAYLYRCGYELMPEHYADFYEILDKQLPLDQARYGQIRKEVYQYTFGDDVSFAELKNAMNTAYFSPKKWD
jgi:CDP-glycerol glycerophosphotransferase (TagB/SpsB family)